MSKLYCIGDLHFGNQHDWSKEVFDKFINWFEQQQFEASSELIQLGDVTERASNLGNTLELVTRFFTIASEKFDTIYIIGGNHDLRVSEYSTQFLPYLDKDKIKTIYDESIFKTKNGFHILALPFKRIDGKLLDEYYSNELPQKFYTTKVDVIVGHVAIKEPKSFYGGIDITKFKATLRAFGHIHTRNGMYKNDYVGSILPFKIDEANTEAPRIIKCIDKNLSVSEIEIPEIIKYDTFAFGEQPKHKKGSKYTYIYTVFNCKNVQQAKNHYPDIYIKGIERAQNNINVKTGEKVEFFESPMTALNNLVKETGIVIKRKTMGLLKSLLENE